MSRAVTARTLNEDRTSMPNAKLLLAALALALAGEPAQAEPPAPMPTRDFVQAAGASDHYEIQAARVAVVEGQDPRIRAFARQMMRDHAQTSQALEQAALASGRAPPPPGLSGDGQQFLAQLQSLRGADFDKAYARQQVLSHHAALVVEEGYAAGGSDPNVRRAAQAAVLIIRRHLEMAQQLP